MSYQYDLAGRRTRVTWPDAFYVQYDYNLLGEVTKVRENGANSGGNGSFYGWWWSLYNDPTTISDNGGATGGGDASGESGDISSGQNAPCMTPFFPAGVKIQENIEEARSHADDFVLAKLSWFYSQTRNGGAWDYKQTDKDNWRNLGSQSPYERFGNFNFGATAEAAGIDFDFAQRAAGWAQRMAGTSDPSWGQPGFPFPFSHIKASGFYGNDPSDYFDSLDGRNYTQSCSN